MNERGEDTGQADPGAPVAVELPSPEGKPGEFLIQLNMGSRAAQEAMADWISSGEAMESFWNWMSHYGRHV